MVVGSPKAPEFAPDTMLPVPTEIELAPVAWAPLPMAIALAFAFVPPMAPLPSAIEEAPLALAAVPNANASVTFAATDAVLPMAVERRAPALTVA